MKERNKQFQEQVQKSISRTSSKDKNKFQLQFRKLVIPTLGGISYFFVIVLEICILFLITYNHFKIILVYINRRQLNKKQFQEQNSISIFLLEFEF